jgi:hypothetical protein
MRDEMDSRMWLEHRDTFANNVTALFAAIGTGLKRLNQIEFDAPWKRVVPPQA